MGNGFGRLCFRISSIFSRSCERAATDTHTHTHTHQHTRPQRLSLSHSFRMEVEVTRVLKYGRMRASSCASLPP